MSKESDEKRKLLKKLWARCYMRLKKQLQRKPTKEEVADCIKGELFKLEHGLEKEKQGRPTSEEEFFDVMGVQTKDDWNPLRRREREELEDIATLRKLNEGLSEWGSGKEPRPTREEQMKDVSSRLNEILDEKSWENVCPVCLSSVCRCPSSEEEE